MSAAPEPVGTIRSYRDLLVWQRGMDLVESVYRLTDTFPRSERYEISSQLRRSTLSIPCNVAEGHGRWHRAAFANHVSMANGSTREVETLLLCSRRLGFAAAADVERLLDQTDQLCRMLSTLARRLYR